MNAYWSVRRELWENRSITVAPLAVAAILLFGFVISAATLPSRLAAAGLDPLKQRTAAVAPFDFAAGLILLTAFLVGVFYCLDALHGERRDRSILFWKSLPVSDLTTVLSKASIPLLVLPPFVFVVILTTRLIMLLLSTLVLMNNASALATFWNHVQFFHSSVALLYAVVVMVPWYAPIYAWLLLVSVWARRVPFLWAVLPPLAIGVFERIAFGTRYVYLALGDRITGWLTHGFDMRRPRGVPIDPLSALTPARFLGTPALWIGLALAAIFLAAAVRLRRDRDPL